MRPAFWRIVRLLVTGGAGFIGSNFIHHLFHVAGAPAACCPDHRFYAGTHGEAPQVLNVDKLTYAGDRRFLAGVDQLPGYRFLKADICDPECYSTRLMKVQATDDEGASTTPSA